MEAMTSRPMFGSIAPSTARASFLGPNITPKLSTLLPLLRRIRDIGDKDRDILQTSCSLSVCFEHYVLLAA
jgi:hypothetical protein